MKTLHLLLQYPDNSLTEKLFSTCPLLQDLSIKAYLNDDGPQLTLSLCSSGSNTGAITRPPGEFCRPRASCCFQSDEPPLPSRRPFSCMHARKKGRKMSFRPRNRLPFSPTVNSRAQGSGTQPARARKAAAPSPRVLARPPRAQARARWHAACSPLARKPPRAGGQRSPRKLAPNVRARMLVRKQARALRRQEAHAGARKAEPERARPGAGPAI